LEPLRFGLSRGRIGGGLAAGLDPGLVLELVEPLLGVREHGSELANLLLNLRSVRHES
jgi:hypothetical protein